MRRVRFVWHEHATFEGLQNRRCYFSENLQTTWTNWLQSVNSFTTYHGTYSMLDFPAMTSTQLDHIRRPSVEHCGRGCHQGCRGGAARQGTADDVTVTLDGDQVLVTVSGLEKVYGQCHGDCKERWIRTSIESSRHTHTQREC